MTVRIANGAGFLGDDLDAPRRLVEAADVDYLTLEYLAELTMSILARLREKDVEAGFAKDFLAVTKSLTALSANKKMPRIVTNAGGVNPRSCAKHVAAILTEAKQEDKRIGVVTGDDLLDQLAVLQSSGVDFANTETGAALSDGPGRIVSAHAYLGAEPVCRALSEEAEIVIAGRVADASLTLAPAVHEFGWNWHDWNLLAAGSVAGHLIECGAQVTGGYSTSWSDWPLTEIGYPIAELQRDGTAVITKPAGSDGCVSRKTVVEQLVYEIGDPQHYLTPDVVADFASVEVEPLGNDRVKVHSAIGKPAPDEYKVSLAYHGGYFASGELLVYGSDCIEKANCCARLVFDRLRHVGVELAETNIEVLGMGDGCPGTAQPMHSLNEVALRLTAADPRRDAVERFSREIAPLITSGPAGLAGYAAGRPIVRPVFAHWPTLVPKELVAPQVEVRTAKEWLESRD